MTNIHSINGTGPRGQSGAVLIVALIILLVMTLLGVSTMESTSLEMRMSSNNQARQFAFQAAEATLAQAEEALSLGVSLAQLQECVPGSATCYEETCAGGLCFNGAFPPASTFYECEVIPPATPVWRDEANWTTAGKHRTVSITGVTNDPKYIIEFLCYVAKDDGSEFLPGTNNGDPVFRITALATSNDDKARVMLQSTYRAN